jgi:hypothetical protein
VPYFVKEDVFSSNGGRPGARCYQIRRRAQMVLVTWSGITVRRGKFVGFVSKPYRCASEYAAIAKRQELVEQRIHREGYKA